MFHSLNILGFLQLAGGTNAHTIEGLKKEGLFQTTITGNVVTWLLNISFLTLLLLALFLSQLHYKHSCLFLEYLDHEKSTVTPSNPSCALISGIAYGGYARKVTQFMSDYPFLILLLFLIFCSCSDCW
jgi:hypothetical protein